MRKVTHFTPTSGLVLSSSLLPASPDARVGVSASVLLLILSSEVADQGLSLRSGWSVLLCLEEATELMAWRCHGWRPRKIHNYNLDCCNAMNVSLVRCVGRVLSWLVWCCWSGIPPSSWLVVSLLSRKKILFQYLQGRGN